MTENPEALVARVEELNAKGHVYPEAVVYGWCGDSHCVLCEMQRRTAPTVPVLARALLAVTRLLESDNPQGTGPRCANCGLSGEHFQSCEGSEAHRAFAALALALGEEAT